MKLLLLGHLCVDRVHAGGTLVRQRWGGIANAVAALGALAAPGDAILPVCGVGSAEREGFLRWLGRLGAVDPSGVFALDGPTNVIDLYDRPGGDAVACAQSVAPPVPWERIRKYLAADGILINMVSGSDITLETLDQIRMEIRARETPVHFDYHNLTTGISPARERVRRPLEEWRRWAFMLQSVQMNEEEAAGLTVERMTEDQLAGHFLTLGTGGVLITRGAQGATLFASEHKKIIRHDVPGTQVARADTVFGLGDVFGAAFIHRYLATRDMAIAAAFAVATAAAAARAADPGEWSTPA